MSDEGRRNLPPDELELEYEMLKIRHRFATQDSRLREQRLREEAQELRDLLRQFLRSRRVQAPDPAATIEAATDSEPNARALPAPAQVVGGSGPSGQLVQVPGALPGSVRRNSSAPGSDGNPSNTPVGPVHCGRGGEQRGLMRDRREPEVETRMQRHGAWASDRDLDTTPTPTTYVSLPLTGSMY